MGAIYCMPVFTLAAVFDGGGLQGGVNAAGTINGPIKQGLRTTVEKILTWVLNFLALAAVTMIIAAGFWLILGMGSDDAKTKAKNIIKFTLIGLVIVIFSRLIVAFFTNELPQIIS